MLFNTNLQLETHSSEIHPVMTGVIDAVEAVGEDGGFRSIIVIECDWADVGYEPLTKRKCLLNDQ